MLGEDAADTRRVADVSHAGANVDADPTLAQLAIDLKEGVLGPVEEDESFRAESGRLAAEFRTDRAARAGDQDPLAREEPLKLRRIQIHRLAAEQRVQF